ncbi:MAG: nickel pincer cofactor biosynthesis protein LarC [Thermoprotei archaeon]|nr:nickel pincer cofactor biosynthesis protein LarC [Thermoprotei archaeon]
MGKALVIDCSSSGIAGDMFLAALLGLGASFDVIEHVVESVRRVVPGIKFINISLEDVLRGHIKAKFLRIDIKEERELHRHGLDLINYAEDVAKELGLSPEGVSLATNIVRTLVEAEAKVHGEAVEHVHLHEAGSADTLIDAVGSIALLEDLGLLNAEIYSTPVALGGGRVKFSHGLSSVPAPATLEILKGKDVPVIGGPVDYELTTPTGAALLVNVVKYFVNYYPALRIDKVSYGAGSRDIPHFINALRLILGEREDLVTMDEVIVLESNVDDVTGEVLGYLSHKLFELGARDVTFMPIYMKKGRPGYMIKVIADADNYLNIVRALIKETGTLGVRVERTCRYIVPLRETEIVKVDVGGREYEVEIKVSKDLQGNIVMAKPEYESVKRAALESGKPIRQVMLDAIKKWFEKRTSQ